ncbi:MAG: hypothetical protein ACTHM1_13120, partial [Solirubrobacteraceae bacterium]
MTIKPVWLNATITCTLNGGAFKIPSSGNASGPVTVNFTTRPTYTECTTGWTVETSGTWTLSAQYGEASTTVTIPPGGIVFYYKGVAEGQNNESAMTFIGGWNNGFESPVKVTSAVSYGGAIPIYWENLKQTSFTQALQTLTDTTHPARQVLLGPSPPVYRPSTGAWMIRAD